MSIIEIRGGTTLRLANGETRIPRIDTNGTAVGGEAVGPVGGRFVLRPKRVRKHYAGSPMALPEGLEKLWFAPCFLVLAEPFHNHIGEIAEEPVYLGFGEEDFECVVHRIGKLRQIIGAQCIGMHD